MENNCEGQENKHLAKKAMSCELQAKNYIKQVSLWPLCPEARIQRLILHESKLASCSS